jgi:hypothetical protein
MKTRLFSFVTLTLVMMFLTLSAADAQNKDKAAPAASGSYTISDEEYAIYSVLMESLYAGRGNKSLVIEKEITGCTGTGNNPEGEKARQQNLSRLPEKLKDLSASTVSSFRTRERQCAKLEDKLAIRTSYKLISKQQRVGIFSQKDPARSWVNFYKKFPGSSGYINVSGIGFNENQSQALIETFMKCGSGCGSNHFALLLKKDGQWSVTATYKVWEMSARR